MAVAPSRARASAHLGSTLRSVLITPRRGFEGALARANERAEVGARPAEGVSPYVLAALGGATAMVLWLKVGSLIGARSVAQSDFRWSFLVAVTIGAALLALGAQALWGAIGSRLFETPARDLRLVWGAAAFPQVGALAILLPLDLLLVGPATFTSTRLEDPVATGWAALSIALAISLAIWSLFLFIRGVEVAARTEVGRAVAATAVAITCAAAVATAVALVLRALAADT